VDAIRADDPICFQQPTIEDHSVLTEARYGRVPPQIDSTLCCPINHLLVKDRSPHTGATLPRKPCFHRSRLVQESNSSEWLAIARIYRDTQFAKRRQCAGHQPFATRFVDGRFCAVRECDLKSSFSCSDGRGQTGGSASDDQHTLALPHEISVPRNSIPAARPISI
jgi:hypothetical protein